MSITSRINEMSSHIEQAYDELQGLGADLTNVNKNIENISMVLDDIYDSMPQVSGEGTSLTLDDTRKGKIKSTLKGNTSQTTYSGKNLANTKITNWSYLGVSVSYDEVTQILTINGTSTGNATLSFGNYNFSPISVSSGERLNLVVKYVSGSATSNDNGRILLADENYTLSMSIPLNGINTDKSEYKNVNSNLNYNILQFGYRNGDIYNNLKIKIMVCKGSDISYQPFVGGTPSPNPSYPQPVNVVSGDNEINVVGKNLLPNNATTQTINGVTFKVNADKSVTLNGTASAIADFYMYGNSTDNGEYYCIPKGTYSISDPSSGWFYIGREKTLGAVVGNSALLNALSSQDCYFYGFIIRATSGSSFSNLTLYPQIEKNSSASTYEPYQGNTYNIDLPVENLLQCNLVSTTTGGVTITNNNDESFTLQGTSTAGIGRDIHGEITLKAGTYTFSADHLPAGVYISLANVSNTILNRVTPSRTFTISTDTTYAKCLLWIDSGYTVNDTIKIQLENGSEQNNFTPYGTTPIELCKIGNYQDYFGKSDGRNLFDKSKETINTIVNSAGTLSPNNDYNSSDYIVVNPSESVVLSTDTTSAILEIVEYDESKTLVNRGVKTNSNVYTLTTNASTHFVRISYQNTSTKTQFEKGNTPTTWQPYGVGKWYLHKEIVKVVLNGSENWGKSSSTANTIFYLSGTIHYKNGTTSSSTDLYCNYFDGKVVWGNNVIGCELYIVDSIRFGLTTSSTITTLEDWKAWLSTHNVVVYYVLATPTITELTYEPLITQLNLLEQAQSKENQTNISQVNNDLPFIISASALKEWQESTSLNSTLSMVNPLSLGNTLNTQENDIQPIEVDNIEPLEEEENEES